jgi:hypothetical protein
MKKIKLNKTWLMMLGIFVTIMLFLLGRHEEAHAAAYADIATITLTDTEKEGLSEAEQKVILAMKKSTQLQMDDFRKGLVTGQQFKEGLDEVRDGLTKKELKGLEDMLKAYGIELNSIKEKVDNGNAPKESPLDIFKKELEEKKDELAAIKRNKSGQIAFTIKTAGPTGTTVIGGETNASIVNNGFSAATLLRLGDGEVHTIQRGTPFILNFVSVGNTDAPALLWFDEVPKEGSFAVTAEGALKPLQQYKFERRTSDYKKAAGYTVITEEFDKDFPRLVSTIKRLMEIDCKNDMNTIILADMVASASAYAYPALDDQIDNADDYAAIGAAIAQVQSLRYTPNVLVLNPADAWRMRLQKGTDGHYVMPPFTWNGQTYEFGKVVVDPSVAVGNFFLGDGSVYNVDLRGDIIVRIGYANDDFIRNQYSMVVEQFFYNYISTSRKTALIYGSFATIKAAIEKP